MTTEALDALKEAQQNGTPVNDNLAKAGYTQGTGLVNYDLERPAKKLYPVLTPLRNRIERVKAHGGTQSNWKAITGINVNRIGAGVSEGRRGGVITDKVEDYFATYKGLGLEHSYTFESGYAAKNFDNVRARVTMSLLQSTMIQEEGIILGGNTSLPLGITPTPTLTANGSGGTLAAGTMSVICVALTADGLYHSTVTIGVATQITRQNADGTTDTYGGGAAQKSAAATATVVNAGSLSASVTPVRGAVAYAWFWGAAGSETLGAITTVACYLITANATGTQLASALPAADYSTNNLVFDGYITQFSKPALNSYYYAMPNTTNGKGTPLTSDGAAGIVEIDNALASFWDNYRLSPDTIWMSAQTMKNISRKLIASGGNTPIIRLNMDANGKHIITGGTSAGFYLNSYGMGGTKELELKVHPNLPNSTIIFESNSIPYPMSDVTDPMVMQVRQEYYQIEWPLRTRQYEFGVYVDEVLKCYFPPAFGMITNIGID